MGRMVEDAMNIDTNSRYQGLKWPVNGIKESITCKTLGFLG